jgi:hypothetical protein
MAAPRAPRLSESILSPMKSPGVRCYDCGFLALRCAREGQWRAHSGYVEAEQWHRDSPDGKFTIVPGETNATHPGEMVCFRGAADLSGEMATAIAEHGDQAARAVIVKHRQCAQWHPYRPGVSPLRQWEELEASLRTERESRLTKVAIACAVIVGLMAMTNDSIGLRWFKALGVWLGGQ